MEPLSHRELPAYRVLRSVIANHIMLRRLRWQDVSAALTIVLGELVKQGLSQPSVTAPTIPLILAAVSHTLQSWCADVTPQPFPGLEDLNATAGGLGEELSLAVLGLLENYGREQAFNAWRGIRVTLRLLVDLLPAPSEHNEADAAMRAALIAAVNAGWQRYVRTNLPYAAPFPDGEKAR